MSQREINNLIRERNAQYGKSCLKTLVSGIHSQKVSTLTREEVVELKKLS
jgi:hypothetical protein